jgi:RNA polymerase sigma-70 factor (ECF subfamily)
MTAALNSSTTNRLLRRAGGTDPQPLADLFARHRERLRNMVRLRLDRRLHGGVRSAAVLQQVYLDVCRRIGEYQARPAQSFFLWLRQLTGERLQAIHRQHLGDREADAVRKLSLHRGALPGVNSVSMAAQLLGDRAANQAAARADLLLRLEEALNGLDPLDREVLALCHFEELGEEELAGVLGLDPAAASARYVRALEQLTAILSSIPGFFDAKGG